MTSINRLTLLFVYLLSITGYAATGPLYSEVPLSDLKDNSAQIVIFRENKFTAGGACFHVTLNEQNVGVLANGGFIRNVVEPGTHSISVGVNNKVALSIDAPPHDTQFVMYSVGLSDLSALPVGPVTSISMGFNFRLAHVSRDYAMQFLPKLRDSSVDRTCMNKQ